MQFVYLKSRVLFRVLELLNLFNNFLLESSRKLLKCAQE